MPFTYDPNAELTSVTLRNGAIVGANNHSNGTDISTFKGKLMVVLTSAAPNGDAASNYTLNVYSHTNNHATGTLVHAFTQVTNAAASIQRVAIDTRNVNGFLSTLINVAGTNINATPIVVAYGTNASAG